MNQKPLRLLTRAGCGLCDDAERDLRRLGLHPQMVDIEQDEELKQRYSEAIPVLLLGDDELARAPLLPERLHQLLQSRGLLE